MHWTRQIIALRAQSRTLQIFDLEAKQKLKSATMNEDVVFWKWISEKELGLVTETSVYHWDIFDPNQAAPVEVFKRNQSISVSPPYYPNVMTRCSFLRWMLWPANAVGPGS